MSFAERWVVVVMAMVSYISEAQKDKYHMLSFKHGL